MFKLNFYFPLGLLVVKYKIKNATKKTLKYKVKLQSIIFIKLSLLNKIQQLLRLIHCKACVNIKL